MLKIILPQRIIFGTEALLQMGDISAGLGRHALLCTGRASLRRSGRLDRVLQLLNTQAVKVTLFDAVEHDPSLATCEAAIALAQENGCDHVIAIGGGSVLDVGKTVSAIAPQHSELPSYFHGDRTLREAPLPFIAAPTTAGTGSECTINAVLSDTDRGIKKSLRDDRMIPTVALVDPLLTVGSPPDITAQAGMDALVQAVECYVSKAANPYSDALALRAVSLLAPALPDAVDDGNSVAKREPVALGSLLTGMAFGNAGLGAVHGLAHPLGIQFGIPHGLVCAVLLPHVCAFNLTTQRDRFADLAPLLGAPTPEDIPQALCALNERLALPNDLGEFGIAESDIPTILADCRSGSMAKNPRTASDDDLADLLRRVI